MVVISWEVKTCGVINSIPPKKMTCKAGNHSGAFKVLNFHLRHVTFTTVALCFILGRPKSYSHQRISNSVYLESWNYLQTFVISLMGALSVPICNFKSFPVGHDVSL